MRKAHLVIVLLAALALLVAACGSDDDTATGRSANAARTVAITMKDNEFVPSSVSVARGATIRFVFTNSGTAAHDAFIGDAAAQGEHEMEMGVESEMDHGGQDDSDDAVTVQRGKSGELEHTFDKAGEYEIGCHQPGHYAAGMKIAITVS